MLISNNHWKHVNQESNVDRFDTIHFNVLFVTFTSFLNLVLDSRRNSVVYLECKIVRADSVPGGKKRNASFIITDVNAVDYLHECL